MAKITVHQTVEWDNELCLRDEPYGHNSVFLIPRQLEVLLAEDFPENQPVWLSQPDASSSVVVVWHYPQSWHFCQPDGRELIIAAADWPAVKAAILRIWRNDPRSGVASVPKASDDSVPGRLTPEEDCDD